MNASIEAYNPMSAYNSAINKLEKNGIRATKYIEDEGKVIDIPTQNIDLDIPSIPACLKLHDIDVIVRIRTLKDKNN